MRVVALGLRAWQPRGTSMIQRLVTGLLKGLFLGGVIGALVQFELPQALTGSGWFRVLLYGLLGTLAGVFAGRPPWKPGAWVESLLKGAFGFAVGCGLYALAAHFLPQELPVHIRGLPAGSLASVPVLFAPVLAMVYSALVELDNTGEPEAVRGTPGVRVANADKLLASIPDEDEAPAAKPRVQSRKQ